MTGRAEGNATLLGAALASVAQADASPIQACQALVVALEDGSPEGAQDAYLALRAWVWKTLDQRRRDPELRQWHDIISASSALMAQHRHMALAERLAALNELLAESFTVGETLDTTDVTRLRHVAKALAFLADHGGWAERSAIGARLSLSRLVLTRILNLMSSAGLIERGAKGDVVVFRLSRAGLEKHSGQAEDRP